MTGDAFEALLAPNLPSVRRFVQTRVRTSDHADDVFQQTLLQAFAHRDQLRASSKFKRWLCSIAMNEVRLFFRTGRPVVSLDEFPQIDSRDSAPSPLARAEQLERVQWLQAGMDTLSDRDREAIRLRDLEEMTLTETAEAFERSESAAKSTHFRARRRLAGRAAQDGAAPASRPMSDSTGQVHRLACLELPGGSHVGRYAARLPGLTARVSCNPLQPSRRGAIPLDRNLQAVAKETADGTGRFREVQR